MSAVPDKRGQLAALRALVAEKFPQTAPVRSGRLRTGCEALDRRGGLLRGGLTEVCGSLAGGQMVLAALLEAAVREAFWVALIDGADAFEPADWPGDQLDRLLWVRCRETGAALKAADILLRDGNLPVLLLDLQMVPERQLHRIPASTWHRFHRVIENSATVLLVLTPRPLVEGTPSRIAVKIPSPWKAMTASRRQLLDELVAQAFERGREDFFPEDREAPAGRETRTPCVVPSGAA
jgi:RecA/RadA recombinase